MILTAVLNLVLLFAVLVAVKNKPYVGALLFAAVKTVLHYFLFKEAATSMELSTRAQLGISVLVGCLYAAVASAFVYFVSRLTKPKISEEESPRYAVGASERMTFRWESIPLIALVLLLLVL